MKYTLKGTFALLVSIFFSLTAFSQGIVFDNAKSWNDILFKARMTGKPIFVDVYTTWCEPCKIMNDQFFIKKEVGEAFNENFICYRIDAEKGEGAVLADQYDAHSYPHFLFINADGKLFARTSGLKYPSVFIEFSKLALTIFKEKRTLAEVRKEYNKNKSDPALLLDYMLYRRANALPNNELFNEYLKKLPEDERFSDRVAEMYVNEKSSLSVSDFACDNLMKYKDQLNPKLENKAEYYLKDLSIVSMRQAVKDLDLKLLDKSIIVYGEDPPTPLNYLKDYFYMDYYMSLKNSSKVTEYARKYYNEYLVSLVPGKMKSYTIAALLQKGTLYALQNGYDKSFLVDAEVWAKRAVELNPGEKYNRFILYNLMYKNGKKEEAKSKMNEMLVEFSDKKDPNYAYYNDVLQKMIANKISW